VYTSAGAFIANASCGRSVLEFANELVKARLLLEAVHAGRSGRLLLQGEVHALVAAVLLRASGLDALDSHAKTQPPHGELREVEQCIGAGEGHAVVGANGCWQAALEEELLERGDRRVLARGLQSFAHQQETRSVVGDGERVAVLAVAQLELPLEVGAPQIVGRCADRKPSPAGSRARAADPLHQAVPMQDRVNRALGRHSQVLVQSANQELANLARAPMGLLPLEPHDQALDLGRQLVGIAHRAPRSVTQRLKAVLLVAVEDLVAGLARDPEFAAKLAH
jgi:hypothetical protein